jgi:tetratricopeptide (TPR) repeat protein
MGELRIGKYRIIGKLGEGGAGVVHRAVQEPLGRVVALKTLNRRHADSARYLEDFQREARIATTLNHENLVRGLDYGQADGHHFFAMEFVDGESLFAIVTREGVLLERRAFEIARQVASALQYATGYDLIHRDIKPGNILISSAGVVKLCDLGLAKLAVQFGGDQDRLSVKIGTASYMSPEQIRGETDLTFRSDIYALGATLYHLVTGRPPFTGDSPQEVARRHLREPVTDPREVNLEISSGAASVIVKMLAKEATERYASYSDLLGDLDAVLAGRPPLKSIQFAARAGDGLGAGISPRRARIRRGRPSLWAAFVLVLILAGSAAAVFVVPTLGGLEPEGQPSPGAEPAGEDATASPPSPESLSGRVELAARRAVLEIEGFRREHPDAPDAELLHRYRGVVERHPGTRAGAEAAKEVARLEVQIESRDHRRVEEALAACLEEARTLAGERRYGAAMKCLATFLAENDGESVSASVTTETARIREKAEARAEDILDRAKSGRESGCLKEARATLESAPVFEIPEIDARIRAALEEVAGLEQDLVRLRREQEAGFDLTAGAVLWCAARGEFDRAAEELAAAARREDLSSYRDDLARLLGDVGEIVRFAQALREGGRGLLGTSVTLRTSGVPPVTRTIIPGDCTEQGLVVKSPRETELISWEELASEDLLRIGMLALEPESIEDCRASALYLIVHGRFKAADAAFEDLRILGGRIEPLEGMRHSYAVYLGQRAEMVLGKAELLRRKDRRGEARELLDALVLQVPEEPGIHLALGALLVQAAEWEVGLARLTRARELGEVEPALLYWMGEAQIGLHRDEEGLQRLSEYLEAASDGPHAPDARQQVARLSSSLLEDRLEELDRRARAACRQKDWATAIDLYAEIERLAPDRKDTGFHLGMAQLRCGNTVDGYLLLLSYLQAGKGSKLSEARREVRAAEKSSGGSSRSEKLVMLGVGSLQVRKFPEALAIFERAVEAAPLRTECYLGRAEAAVRVHELKPDRALIERARRDLEIVVRLDPSEKRVSELFALALLHLGDLDQALHYANLARDQFPDRWQACCVAGMVQALRGKHALAVHLFSEGIRRAPDEAALYVNRALALEKLERYDEAATDLKVALEKGPSAVDRQRIEEARRRLVEAASRR